MSERLKYGESYESLAHKLEPYLNTSINIIRVPGKIKYGMTYEVLANWVKPFLIDMPATESVGSERLKFGDNYRNIANNIWQYLSDNTKYSIKSQLYPLWWDTTITVYNRYEDPITQLVTWHRSVLVRNFWKNSHNKINVGQTVLETNNIILRIPQNNMFLEYGQWINKRGTQMDNYFTFNQGDIIVKGEVDDIINEYEAGHRASDLLEKYKKQGDCFQIESFQNNTGIGRGTPHYYIQGV